jgi:hypothetical protein
MLMTISLKLYPNFRTHVADMATTGADNDANGDASMPAEGQLDAEDDKVKVHT